MSELPKYLEELCEVQLTSKEIEAASDAFVKACSEEDDAKEAHKSAMTSIKEAKESALKSMTRKRESRLVRCLADWNYPVSGRVTLTRTDNRETFERKMTGEELAPFLPIAAKKETADAAAELLPEAVAELQQAAAAEIIAANAADEDPSDRTNSTDLAANETAEASSETKAPAVLCDKCGHWHDFTLATCPKCEGKMDADQVKARDFAAGWEVRAKEAGFAHLPPPWRATDELEEYDHLYLYSHNTEAFCGHIADDAERAKYKTQPGFPPDHYACPVCISMGHRILDQILERGKPAKKAKAHKAPKSSYSGVNNPAAAPTAPEETHPETQEEI